MTNTTLFGIFFFAAAMGAMWSITPGMSPKVRRSLFLTFFAGLFAATATIGVGRPLPPRWSLAASLVVSTLLLAAGWLAWTARKEKHPE